MNNGELKQSPIAFFNKTFAIRPYLYGFNPKNIDLNLWLPNSSEEGIENFFVMPLPNELRCLIRVETRFLRRYRTSQLYFQMAESRMQLSYSGQDCKRIPAALNKMFGSRVECLDLSFNSIMTLNGLGGFPMLRDLILDNNQISEIRQIPHMPHLVTLSLNNNLITNLEFSLKRISEQLPNLTYLSLLGNPACPDQLSDSKNDDADYQRYRYYVLYHLPKLKFLDFRRVSSHERTEAKLRGQFLYVRKPKNYEPILPACSPSPYSSLPISASRPQHKGAYGKCHYKYSGKHSEGNRFICNGDL